MKTFVLVDKLIELLTLYQLDTLYSDDSII